MNFEQFSKFLFRTSKPLTKNHVKRAKKILHYYYSILKLHRQKLKLGKILFIINEFDLNKPFQEIITLKFVNQDQSESLEEKIKEFDENLK
jgi:hypothetical protein